MNRSSKTILAIFFILVITISAVVVVDKISGFARMDITDQKIYSLSDGTKTILKRITQPVKVELYYAETAALKAPDAIKRYNDYYYFVKALLEEYAKISDNIQFDVIDPRPFSDQEQDALRYGLKRFPITQDEGFFFGLVAKTEYGASKSIEFFAPDRQNLIEYDISYLLDTLTTREKSKIGVISSLEVMGEELSPYMRQMMMQTGQRPKQPWIITQHLGQKYEVEKIEQDVDEISGVDMLLVIHPKDFSDKTLFAIDQYVLNGGRAIFMVDPHCLADMPKQEQQQMYGMQQQESQASSINKLLEAWGVTVPADEFAGDKLLAEAIQMSMTSNPQKLIGYLNFRSEAENCFNQNNVISADLDTVKMVFSSVINKLDSAPDGLEMVPLVSTTPAGNTWKPSSPYALKYMNPPELMKSFKPGNKSLAVGCLLSGKFKSAFPDGIEVEVASSEESEGDTAPKTEKKTGITESVEKSNIAIFTDVDFITDALAYNNSPFGASPKDDNSALLMNTVDNLLGSDELIAIRSRGNFRRPFTLVDKIEAEAEEATEKQVQAIQDDIKGFEAELSKVINEARSQGQLVVNASDFEDSQRELELKIAESKQQLRKAQQAKRQDIEALGTKLQYFNTVAAPAVILLISIVLTIQRQMKRRNYLNSVKE